MLGVAGVNPLWYISRGAGFAGLGLIALIGLLGILTAQNVRLSPKLGKAITPELHRNLSLVAVVVLSIHVLAAVLDPFVHLGYIDIVVPFAAHYRQIWIGLGALSLDLAVAIIITSLLRVKFGYRSWKLVHWLSYPIFALSVIHGIASGTDTRYLLGKVFYFGVAAILLVSVFLRINTHPSLSPRRRLTLTSTALAIPALTVLWTLVGPMSPDWSHRANLGIGAAFTSTRPIGTPLSSPSPALLQLPPNFSSLWNGTITVSPSNQQGEFALRLLGPLTAKQPYQLDVTLLGQPSGGGVSMYSSIVEVVSKTGVVAYSGKVAQLSGGSIALSLKSPTGNSVLLNANVTTTKTTFSGSVTVGSSQSIAPSDN